MVAPLIFVFFSAGGGAGGKGEDSLTTRVGVYSGESAQIKEGFVLELHFSPFMCSLSPRQRREEEVQNEAPHLILFLGANFENAFVLGGSCDE